MQIEKRLPVDEQRIKEVIWTALDAKEQNKHLFENGITPPEKPFIDLLLRRGEEIGSKTFALNALFLSTAFVFGDSTTRFFNKISAKEKVETYDWLFMPDRLLDLPNREIELGLRQFFEPAGYNANVIPQWKHNLWILKDKYDGDIRNFFSTHGDDAVKIVKALYVRNRAKTAEKTKSFRRYGPKLAHLAIQWISQYGLYPIKNIENTGLPIDFQLARIFIQTSGLILEKQENVDTVVYKTLLPVLTKICRENQIDPRKVSETIWTIGSKLCSKLLHNECPLQDLCTNLISSKPYQRRGIFDPTDIGRYQERKVKKSSL